MLKVAAFEGGFDHNFCYLAWCPIDGPGGVPAPAVIIDPALPATPIDAVLRRDNLELIAILITHSHGDHLAGLPDWVFRYPRVPVVGHRRPVSPGLPNYRRLEDGGTVALGTCTLELLETPGHYPDSVCWFHREGGQLFTGDTVFVGRTGRTIGPLSSTEELYRSVYERILVLPPVTTIYPGHNYGPAPTATLAALKRTSDFFRCGNASEFETVMANFERERRRGD